MEVTVCNGGSPKLSRGGVKLGYHTWSPRMLEKQLNCSSALKEGSRCNCCPYGYHIDLDFVRYCEALKSGNYLDKLKRQKRDKRRQRKSMEAYLGIIESEAQKEKEKNVDTVQTKPLVMRKPTAPPPDLLYTSDALRDAMQDFEETLLNSKKSGKDVPDSNISRVDLLRNAPTMASEKSTQSESPHLPSGQLHSQKTSPSPASKEKADELLASIFGSRSRSGSTSSLSSQSTVSSIGVHTAPDLSSSYSASQQIADTMAALNSSNTVGINRAILTKIRDQMATSLQRMKDLEEQVKSIPILQVKMSVLREEKRLLMLQLKAKSKYLGQRTVGVGDFPVHEVKSSEEDDDQRIKRLEARGIITPRLKRKAYISDEYSAESCGDEEVSPSAFVASLNIALSKKGSFKLSDFHSYKRIHGIREKTAVKDDVRSTKSVGTHCSVLTREIGVGHVPDKLKTVGVGDESISAPSVCKKCSRRFDLWQSSLSSSELGDSDSEPERRSVLKTRFHSCLKCFERSKKKFESQGTNTEAEYSILQQARKKKLEQLTFDVCQQTSVRSEPQPCAECEKRRKSKVNKVSSGTNTDRTPLKDSSASVNIPTKEVKREVRTPSPEQKKRYTRTQGTQIIQPIMGSTGVQVTPISVRKRDVMIQHNLTDVRHVGVQVQGTSFPSMSSMVTTGTGDTNVWEVICDHCSKVRKRSVGVGQHTIYDMVCEQCSDRQLKSIAVGDHSVEEIICDNCSNRVTKTVGCGNCLITDTFCDKCELKQMETIGVGDFDINIPSDIEYAQTPVKRPDQEFQSVGTNTFTDATSEHNLSRASSLSSFGVRLCDKCNCTIETVAKDFIDKNVFDPVLQPISSRIPKLTSSRSRQVKQSMTLSFENKHAVVSSSETSPVKESSPEVKPPERFENETSKVDSSETSESSETESSESLNEGSYDGIIGSIINRCTDDEAIKQGIPGATMYNPLKGDTVTRQKYELSREVKAACKVLNDYLMKPERGDPNKLKSAVALIQLEWFKIASPKNADPHLLEDYMDSFEELSRHLLHRIVNMADVNGNTALHYAVSHGNFDVVSILLDSKVCDVSKQNKAGYTAMMLVALAEITNETHKHVVRRLFQLGDVNTKATQNGQTALMLAVSHGRLDTVKLLLEAGSEANLQDNDGSTALMCAAEHGHMEIVKLLLAHPDCETNLTDNDGSTALAIAMEAGHKDIALLIYASTNFSRGSSPYSSLRSRKHGTPRSTPPPRTPPPPSPARSRKSSSSIP